MENIKMTVAQNLKYYRELNKLTQKQVAEFLGVKHNAVSSWESGTNSIDIVMLIRLCDLFNVSLDLMYGKNTVTSNLSEQEQKLLSLFRSVNKETQLKFIMRLEILLEDKELKKNSKNANYVG